MGAVTYKKLIDHYFNASTLSWFYSESFRISREVITINFPYAEECYTYTRGSRTHISLGKKFYNLAVTGLPFKDEIETKKLKHTYKDVSAVYKGALYHELSHRLYTDMKTFQEFGMELYDRGYPDLAKLFKMLANTVEDVVIEDDFAFYYPTIGKFLAYLRLRIFSDTTIEKFKDEMDPDDPSHLFQFMLYRYRVPKRVNFEHPLYTKEKKMLHSGMYVCLNTVDPTLRLERALAFAYEIMMHYFDESEKDMEIDEVLKGKGIDWIKSLPKQTHPKEEVGDVKGSPTDADGDEDVDASTTPTKEITKKGTEASSEVSEEAKEETDKEEDHGVARRAPMEDSPLDPSDGSAPDPDTSKMSDRVARNAANDEPVINQEHRAMYIHDYIDFKKYAEHYKDVVHRHADKINHLVKIVKKMKAINNNRYQRHEKKGKLDKRKMVKDTDTVKLFKKRLAPRKEADLAFSILVDNSGSMYGLKSTIVGEALIILQETLYRLGVPFEVNGFTEGFGGQAITLEMHRFGDKYHKTKYGATLWTKMIDQGHPTHTFEGNVDESNLQFVGGRFLHNRKEKDKIMIVMSDGATTGSANVLSHVSKNLESRGITMLGVGIVDDNVEDIYSDHYVFSNVDDLKNLATVIQDYILKKVFK